MKADTITFKVLNAIFVKDANHVFYIEGIARNIDASTFIPLDVGKIEKTDPLCIDESRRWSYIRYGGGESMKREVAYNEVEAYNIEVNTWSKEQLALP